MSQKAHLHGEHFGSSVQLLTLVLCVQSVLERLLVAFFLLN